MLKILGSLFITISGMLIGKKICDRSKKKIDCLEDFKKFIFYAKNEIEYKKTYPFEMIQDFNCSSELKSFFKKCIYLIDNGENFPDAWKKTFNSCFFDKNHTIFNFGKELGSYDIENQIKICEFSSNNIESQIEKLKQIAFKQERMLLIVGTCVGAIISIILL